MKIGCRPLFKEHHLGVMCLDKTSNHVCILSLDIFRYIYLIKTVGFRCVPLFLRATNLNTHITPILCEQYVMLVKSKIQHLHVSPRAVILFTHNIFFFSLSLLLQFLELLLHITNELVWSLYSSKRFEIDNHFSIVRV